jgi:hypothetical protein
VKFSATTGQTAMQKTLQRREKSKKKIKNLHADRECLPISGMLNAADRTKYSQVLTVINGSTDNYKRIEYLKIWKYPLSTFNIKNSRYLQCNWSLNTMAYFQQKKEILVQW